jgi:hypothetical protein
MFKKWNVDNKVLEKLFHERQGHNKSVFDNNGDIIKVTKSVILLLKSYPPGDHIL